MDRPPASRYLGAQLGGVLVGCLSFPLPNIQQSTKASHADVDLSHHSQAGQTSLLQPPVTAANHCGHSQEPAHDPQSPRPPRPGWLGRQRARVVIIVDQIPPTLIIILFVRGRLVAPDIAVGRSQARSDDGRLGGRRFELHPPIARKVSLHPGVTVVVTHPINTCLGVVIASHIAHGHPGRNAYRSRHHHHGRRIIVAITFLQIKEKPIHPILIRRRRLDQFIVLDLAQVSLQGRSLVVGIGFVARNLLRQVSHPLGERIGRLQVTRFDPLRVIGAGSPQAALVGGRDSRDGTVTLSALQRRARIDHGDVKLLTLTSVFRQAARHPADTGLDRPIHAHRLGRRK